MRRAPEIRPEVVQQASATAGVQVVRKMPFDGCDPDARPDKAFRFETNAYDRALFAYVAALRGKGESVRDVILRYARQGALRELGKAG